MQKLLFLSIFLSILLYPKSYDRDSKSSIPQIKVKIKKKFTIPKKIDHKKSLKPVNKRPKKIKKDRGIIAKGF